jgi:hypothetical protein
MVLAEEAFSACMCVVSHAAVCVRGSTAERLTVRAMASSLSQSQGIQRRSSPVELVCMNKLTNIRPCKRDRRRGSFAFGILASGTRDGAVRGKDRGRWIGRADRPHSAQLSALDLPDFGLCPLPLPIAFCQCSHRPSTCPLDAH